MGVVAGRPRRAAGRGRRLDGRRGDWQGAPVGAGRAAGWGRRVGVGGWPAGGAGEAAGEPRRGRRGRWTPGMPGSRAGRRGALRAELSGAVWCLASELGGAEGARGALRAADVGRRGCSVVSGGGVGEVGRVFSKSTKHTARGLQADRRAPLKF